jgi:hypothetical protein
MSSDPALAARIAAFKESISQASKGDVAFQNFKAHLEAVVREEGAMPGPRARERHEARLAAARPQNAIERFFQRARL